MFIGRVNLMIYLKFIFKKAEMYILIQTNITGKMLKLKPEKIDFIEKLKNLN